ncbi:MAG: DUF1289 domain-containing protein [Ramlibacter sp.]|nr:DUF1289 domain-containing protein [Ramlibacter sp.]
MSGPQVRALPEGVQRVALARRARLVGAGLVKDVPSPCVSVCKVCPETELCQGCLRTLDEIAAWSRMDDGARREVWKIIAQRLEQGPR